MERSESQSGQPQRKELDYSSPFRVVIIEDCRPEIERGGPKGDLTGHHGVCLGLFNTETEEPDPTEGNPLIEADNGDRIWGIECWWTKEELGEDVKFNQLQFDLEIHKRDILDASENNDKSFSPN